MKKYLVSLFLWVGSASSLGGMEGSSTSGAHSLSGEGLSFSTLLSGGYPSYSKLSPLSYAIGGLLKYSGGALAVGGLLQLGVAMVPKLWHAGYKSENEKFAVSSAALLLITAGVCGVGAAIANRQCEYDNTKFKDFFNKITHMGNKKIIPISKLQTDNKTNEKEMKNLKDVQTREMWKDFIKIPNLNDAIDKVSPSCPPVWLAQNVEYENAITKVLEMNSIGIYKIPLYSRYRRELTVLSQYVECLEDQDYYQAFLGINLPPGISQQENKKEKEALSNDIDKLIKLARQKGVKVLIYFTPHSNPKNYFSYTNFLHDQGLGYSALSKREELNYQQRIETIVEEKFSVSAAEKGDYIKIASQIAKQLNLSQEDLLGFVEASINLDSEELDTINVWVDIVYKVLMANRLKRNIIQALQTCHRSKQSEKIST